MTDSSEADHKLDNIDCTDFLHISPFYCYCLVLKGLPPSKISHDERKKMKDSWKDLKTSFKLYYVDMANSKCGGKWNSDKFYEKDGVIIAQKTQLPVQRFTPITDIIDLQNNQQNNDFNSVLNKIENTINLTTKMHLYDTNNWAGFSN
ncbi:hypothetical protein TVAG_486010 [Trichomonas vaginalis G3]|uniref:Uncharacterized protein n=1 Tax=Trichomonas vaginalis (strain ATCC PRA-98 / G3) TaxID=412133 RepID=A2EEE8_TRIV3|nr:hypothetical protein TVAGG3_0658420 [Trichomonas vaginalis G3]XP_001321177.1 hypothetical protein TVAGG3_0691420 [Trichomonas vaginalis G3]EAX66994.1 hypothetical protein TVAG_502020 [Trichomonas vaginalis G3]EAX78671.1 hypothetical protein TVAG_506040 [Trichomonas vaginalis G3]EAY08954.1 hypothetical protein TVAG_486010 [Trichomonas vaginalis G3]KAI5506329.1 hypothetical protein TVAGG3_0658420 [Trichomonas vaginalis G3]KAI5508597.1 hypothetical protein TVAGG3_0691420 [Trichomonas vaginali|eukprot:XP_001279924.1 hypothetical protein [Trichomonas vaginalis G3]